MVRASTIVIIVLVIMLAAQLVLFRVRYNAFPTQPLNRQGRGNRINNEVGSTSDSRTADTAFRPLPKTLPKVAYAVTITKLEEGKKGFELLDGIDVLGTSIDIICAVSVYPCDKLVFVLPSVPLSRLERLEKRGWQLLVRPVPIDVNMIEGTFLRNRIEKTGCCGASELIKLHAFTLEQYHRVLYLDADALMLKPVDNLFNIDKDLVYTADVNMASSPRNMPVQGGFLLCRPSMDTFNTLVKIVLKGDFAAGSGWAKSGIGFFYGGATIQGLLAYYFRHAAPEKGFEADRCLYNHMWDSDDCRKYSVDRVFTLHFTGSCPKPWMCGTKRKDGCILLTQRWQDIRAISMQQQGMVASAACSPKGYNLMLK